MGIVRFSERSYRMEMRKNYEYYSNENNFLEITSEIYYSVWKPGSETIIICLKNVPDNFANNIFYIGKESYKEFKNNP